MTDLTALPISELRAGLAKGTFSSVDLVQASLARISSQVELNSFITVDESGALEQAREADKARKDGNDGSLLGIPIAVKDMILTKGVRTTCASQILSNFIPPYDATVVKKLRTAGAVIVGKTNLDEFAMGSSTENSSFGVVKNPWNRECVPGGSSGGSAAAVAARLVPGALGTDTGGSIRQPASFCGIVGIKPTYGRVSRYGVVAYASSLDQVGPFARSVEDCAILTDVLAGCDPSDSTSVDIPPIEFDPSATDGKLSGMKLGVPKEYLVAGLHPEVKAAFDRALAQYTALGAEIIEVSLPHTEAAIAVYYILAPAEASSNLSRYDGVRYGNRAAEYEDLEGLYSASRTQGFGKEVQRRIMIGTYVLSSGYYDAYYLKAQKVRNLITRDFERAFEQCDLIVAPTSPIPPFKIGEKSADPLEMYLCDIFTIPVNLAGLPGMSVPCGFDSTGLPIGLQLIGKAWDEKKIFQVGHAYEKATEWAGRAPSL